MPSVPALFASGKKARAGARPCAPLCVSTKLKGAVQNLASELETASAMDINELGELMKQTKMFDPKQLVYQQAYKENCELMEDDELELFYKEVKKAGTFLKDHPGKKLVEEVLVERNMYVRNDDGSVTKNSAYKWFK